MNVTRRSFLGLGTCMVAGTGLSGALQPFNRQRPSISGLSLTSYSMKRYMRWWLGKPARGGGKMEMTGFLDYCAELGLKAAEITGYFFPEPLGHAEIHAVRRRAHLLGLDLSGGAMGNNFACSPGSLEGKRHLEYTRMWIDRFAEMGTPVIRVFATRGIPGGVSEAQVIDNVTANLEHALKHAEKRGVILALENHDFVRNINHLLEILGRIESKWLGVTWDSANLAPVADPYGELARIAPYAVTAQIKVMTRVNGEDVPADYGRLVGILREANYRGYLVLEYEEAEDPREAIPRELAKLRSVVGDGQRNGTKE
ncbi:MAG: xylose isomerase [Roseibacillus sp.]|nr:xylose isomerase [Roseibacillus sp.]MBP35717.1 xylose isomerase [Roseibacillus sp.]MBP35926.1 xylose isomerase [Roseibacillus sp.]MCP4728889.1 TIM barrel protein [Roseibacillus sp.]MDP7106634.1 sugar phosphate isomerase/epimerase family protein [Roseibacillus sp.]